MDYIRSERRYSAHTVSNYGRDIASLLGFLEVAEEDFDPAAVTADDIRKWIVSLSHEGLSNSSINRMISSTGSMFRYFMKKGWITKNPFQRVTALKTPEKLPVYITENKMERIVDELLGEEGEGGFKSSRDALVVLFLYSTGIRLAELIDIDRDDFMNGHTKLVVHGKGDKDRVVPIILFLKNKILAYTALIKELNICKSGEKALFLTEKGERISRTEVYRIVNEKLEMMGVHGKRSPHVLRHTFATHLLNSGADIREIQELLGHTSLRATQVYTHNSIAKLQEAYNDAHPRARKHK